MNMLKQWNELLKKAKEEELTFGRLEKEKKQIELALAHLKNKKEYFEKQLQKKEKNVNALKNKFSIKSLFYMLLGIRKRRISIEERELLSAKLVYENCFKELELLENDLLDIKNAKEKVENWKIRYDLALKWKENILLKTPTHKNYEKIILLIEHMAQKEVEVKELKEVLSSGNETFEYLKKICLSLKKAEDWADLDIVGVFGIFADGNKYSWLNKCRTNMFLFKKSLSKFEEELKDVKTEYKITLEVGTFLNFADFFLEGFVADIIVRNKISKSLKKARHILKVVSDILVNIKREYEKIRHELELLEIRRELLLEQSI